VIEFFFTCYRVLNLNTHFLHVKIPESFMELGHINNVKDNFEFSCYFNISLYN
jgi:hypothetical protein